MGTVPPESHSRASLHMLYYMYVLGLQNLTAYAILHVCTRPPEPQCSYSTREVFGELMETEYV